MTKEEEFLRKELATAYRIAAYLKWDDLIYGHLSSRIPTEPNCYLINPFGLMFDEITPDNLLKMDFSGNILSTNPYQYNPAGENVHSAIYEERQDINGIIHIHTNEGMAISALKESILPLTQHSCHILGRLAHHPFEGIATERDERSRICHDLGDKEILILKNHGVLTVGVNIIQAFCTMYMVQKTMQAQILVQSLNSPLKLIENHIVEKVIDQANTFGSNANYQMEWDALVRMIKRKENIPW
jgi:ribulose-5-phosphate 4-epimerase/fuculose-1-phosphate aldolase